MAMPINLECCDDVIHNGYSRDKIEKVAMKINLDDCLSSP